MKVNQNAAWSKHPDCPYKFTLIVTIAFEWEQRFFYSNLSISLQSGLKSVEMVIEDLKAGARPGVIFLSFLPWPYGC